MQRRMRTVLNFVVGFALAGALLSSWLAPKALAWWATPGFNKSTGVCSCADIKVAVDSVVVTQMVGIGIGALLGLIAGIAFKATRKKGTPPAAAAA
jgi:hypothetical protein